MVTITDIRGEKVELEEVSLGNAFMFDNELYMVLYNPNRTPEEMANRSTVDVVKLSNGEMLRLHKSTDVNAVSINILIKEL